MSRELVLADAINLRVPMCFVTEPDPVWAETAMVALLEEIADSDSRTRPDGHPSSVVRWTRTRGWKQIGHEPFPIAGYSQERMTAKIDVLDQLVPLLDAMEDPAGRHKEKHPVYGALIALRGLAPDLDRPAVVELLFDIGRLSAERSATVLIELDAPLEAHSYGSRLGPSFGLPDEPVIRYRVAVERVQAAAVILGGPAADERAVLKVLGGLSQMEAELVGRLVQAEAELGAKQSLMALLDEARRRVTQSTRIGRERHS